MLRARNLALIGALIGALIRALAVVCAADTVEAADLSPAASEHELKKKRMKMNEPMETGMMKQGMMKGDVKNAAERKDRTLQPMMEQEEKTMPAAPRKP